MASVLSCTSCGRTSSNSEDYNHLSLDISPEGTLQDCLALNFKSCVVDFRCPNCDGLQASRREQFHTLPRVLVLHLKRFRHRRWGVQKLKRSLLIPPKLSLSTLCGDDVPPLHSVIPEEQAFTNLDKLAALKERLGSMEQEQTVLKYSMGTMGQKLGAVEIKLQASESEVEMMKTVNTAQEKELYSLKERLSVAQPKIAFSVALSDSFNGHTGPFSIDTPLKYLRVFSNSGSGYNPATGIFTAMVRGMYCFRYTMYSNNSGRPNSVLYLMKNNELLVTTWNTANRMDVTDSSSNGVIVQLEVGDNVYLRLGASRLVYDDSNHHNTFSGFLLFTV
ncbi:hypothetical protein DPEC_G00324730 [Dallia pectoralis]|uniref:Uncharacterized protein n=1 Tax=Dallia pectoralis TaxID=75939 RepID=A0ACC2FBB2_DALPE|nr:hypothetical protein DPEC_G00324730 [Dallia pectoralis]